MEEEKAQNEESLDSRVQEENAGETGHEAVEMTGGEPDDEEAGAFAKAGVLNRIIARFIDILIALLFAAIPGYIGVFAALTYIGIADGFMGGQSPGKRIIGLRVLCPGKGRPVNFQDSVLRNSTIGLLFILSLVPVVGWLLASAGLAFELVLVIGSKQGKRLGDEIASTVVAEDAKTQPGFAG